MLPQQDGGLWRRRVDPTPPCQTVIVVPTRIEPRLVNRVPEIGVSLNKLTLFTMERKVMFSLSNMK
jgi:hypothetical protein